MRVLVVWGSRMGGTAELAEWIGLALREAGIEVDVKPAAHTHTVRGYDAAIVGGALYTNLWHRGAARFVARHQADLRRIPVWLFSSGPLDDSADRLDTAPVQQVAVLRDRIGALGHRTFGGRLAPDAKGFPAAAMARRMSGDWRNRERVAAWAREIAQALPGAKPGQAIDLPAGSPARLAAYGLVGWAICAVVMAVLLRLVPAGWAMGLHALAAPLVFAGVSWRYFRTYGARDPLPTAIAFTAIVAALDAGIVAGMVLGDFSMFARLAGIWLPFLLIFAASWATGQIMLMMPASEGQPTHGPYAGPVREAAKETAAKGS